MAEASALISHLTHQQGLRALEPVLIPKSKPKPENDQNKKSKSKITKGKATAMNLKLNRAITHTQDNLVMDKI